MSKTTAPILDMVMEPKPETPAALPATVSADPALTMIERFAADPNFDVAKLQALMDMRDRELARVAESAFNQAMASAQAEMIAVAPDQRNKQTNSDYASYAALDRMARPIYTTHGFGLSFDSQESKLAEHVLVVCYVSHRDGFSRTYRADMPADGKGPKGNDVMTKTHATGSAFSYAQRYLLRLIFNLAVGEDDDGNKASGERVLPDGFAEWIFELHAIAKTGAKALTEKWQTSKRVFQDAILAKEWEEVKAVARDADKAASDA